MRFFIYLQYDGTAYHGWQNQPNCISVQEKIEKTLSMLLRRELFIVGAGRTDAGVHARLMIAHFDYDGFGNPEQDPSAVTQQDLEAIRKQLDTLTFKMNGVLPPDISIIKIVPVKPEAHARFSATSRTYHYYVTTRKTPFDHLYTMRTFRDLDVNLMNQAASHLFDYSDFTSFAKLHSDVKTHICRIMEAHWDEVDGQLVFTIKADRFLRNMVRAIVGTLMWVGRGRLSIEEFCHIIERKDRCMAGDSVPASGLFLEDVGYPDELFYNE